MGVVRLLLDPVDMGGLGVPADLRWNGYSALDWALILGRNDIAAYLIYFAVAIGIMDLLGVS